ncbi:hypothetical protein COO60DRAFT_1518593 [Scenedesmus sp. NREL 46B-D3]|nr:hypothetical protein COO60DRAFT_1518593 [Scenedesmus sp. NREL 46B-D3]
MPAKLAAAAAAGGCRVATTCCCSGLRRSCCWHCPVQTKHSLCLAVQGSGCQLQRAHSGAGRTRLQQWRCCSSRKLRCGATWRLCMQASSRPATRSCACRRCSSWSRTVQQATMHWALLQLPARTRWEPSRHTRRRWRWMRCMRQRCSALERCCEGRGMSTTCLLPWAC